MGQLQSNDEIYSVLYVDFDNMYTRLAEQDIGLAKIFATSPHKWMRWIDGHAIRMMYGDGIRRRILKRVCYMNSVRYAEFKPFFVRSGFIVQDCIPAFNQSKSNVDILLTMNCLDDLQHVTRYDEFIILSADSDFTPLIFRINENARRSIVLSVGHTAPAYASACSWRIREDWFLTQALEESREDGDETHDRFEHGSKSIERRAEPRNRPNYEIGAKDVAPKGNAVTISVYQRMKLVEAIKQLVAESNVSTVEELLAVTFEGKTLEEVIKGKIASIGEKITVRRFEKYEGNLSTYIHNGKIGVMLVSDKADDVVGKDVCLHIASSAPEFLSSEDVPQEVRDEEKRIEMGKEDLQSKPENIREKIVEGRLHKILAQRCLLEQAFVKDPSQSVKQYIEGKFAIAKFDRYVLGEGLEKREENFADEVMGQLNK